MKTRPRKMLFLALCFAQFGNIGCTTLETVHSSPEALAQKKIERGDSVTLEFLSGHTEQVKLTKVGNQTLSGVTGDGRVIEVAYVDLLSLQRKKVGILKTAGLAVGVVAAAAVITTAVAAGTAVALSGGG